MFSNLKCSTCFLIALVSRRIAPYGRDGYEGIKNVEVQSCLLIIATIPAKIVETLCRFLDIFSPDPPLPPLQC